MTFAYNGFGRVEGQAGGPGGTHGKPGARVPISLARRVDAQRAREHHPPPPPPPEAPAGPSANTGRYPKPIAFGESPSPLRLFGVGLGDQAGWILPFAFFGLIAALVLLWLERRGPQQEDDAAQRAAGAAAPAWRRDPRLAAVIVLGGWFAVEGIVLSLSKGIVHPYYVSALAPGAGAMAGIGLYSLIAPARLPQATSPTRGSLLSAAAVVSTVAVEIVLDAPLRLPALVRPGARSSRPRHASSRCSQRRCFAAGRGRDRRCRRGRAAARRPRRIRASTTWLAPVQATFPAAGPSGTRAGHGGDGLNARAVAIDRAPAGLRAQPSAPPSAGRTAHGLDADGGVRSC